MCLGEPACTAQRAPTTETVCVAADSFVTTCYSRVLPSCGDLAWLLLLLHGSAGKSLATHPLFSLQVHLGMGETVTGCVLEQQGLLMHPPMRGQMCPQLLPARPVADSDLR